MKKDSAPLMDNDETLSGFLKSVEKGDGPALIVTRKQPAKKMAETVHTLLAPSHILEPEALTALELEVFLSKRIREEGILIVPLTSKTPLQVAGYLNTLFEQNRFKRSGPSGWETLTPHPRFKIVVVAEEGGLASFSSLVKKNHFRSRLYINKLLESV